MMRLLPAVALPIAGSLPFAAGCMGDGSDIGPTLAELPQSVYTVDLEAPDGTQVVDARVDLGRAFVFSEESGTAEVEAFTTTDTFLQVDARRAGTVTTAELGSLRVDLEPAGAALPFRLPQSPFLVTLPDFTGRTRVTLSEGALPNAVNYADGDVSLDFAVGAVVSRASLSSRFDGVGDLELVATSLAGDRMPPLVVSDGPLTGRAIRTSDAVVVGPIDFAVSVPGDLTLDQDLGLQPGETARVFRLDPLDGLWGDVGASEPFAAGQPLRANGVIQGGGLYAFAVEAPSISLIGEVRFGAEGQFAGARVFGLRLRASQSVGVTAVDGSFRIDGVALPDAGTLTIHLDGGAGFGPDTAVVELDLSTVTPNQVVDLDRLDWPFQIRTDYRVLFLDRSELAPFRLVGVNSVAGSGGLAQLTDRDAELILRDLEQGIFSSFSARLDERNVQSVVSLESFDGSGNAERRTRDLLLFSSRRPWLFAPASTQTFVFDEQTRAYAANVDIFRTTGDEEEFADATGSFVPRLPPVIQTGDREQFTGVSEFGDVISAYSATDVAVGRLELLIDRGAFPVRGPQVEIEGSIPNGGPEYRLVSSPLIDREAFFGQRADGLVVGAGLPAPSDPVGTMDPDFVATSLVRNGSFVAALSGSAGPLGLRPSRVHFVEIDPSLRGTRAQVDLGAGAEVVNSRRFVEALQNLDGRLTGAPTRIDVGIELRDGRVVALGELDASVEGDGSARVFLPDGGVFAGGSPIAVVTVEGVDGAGATLRQRGLFIDRPEVATPLFAVPSIQAPSVSASVPAAGFDVDFTLPQGTVYGELLLRRNDGLRAWRVGVPPEATSYRFRQLPEDVQPLEAGDWTLTLRAFRIRSGATLNQSLDAYQSVLARRVTLGLPDLGVDAISEVEIPLTITP